MPARSLTTGEDDANLDRLRVRLALGLRVSNNVNVGLAIQIGKERLDLVCKKKALKIRI